MVVIAGTVAVLAGTAGARGGNHGCNADTGTFYESHFFEEGDHVVAGYADVESTPRGANDEIIRTGNAPDPGPPATTLICSADEDGTWRLFVSDLGAGDDRLRMDARGLDDGQVDFGPLTPQISSRVRGGTGGDRIAGHVGVDDIAGGKGPDVIKLKDGKDVAKGGAGRDLIRAAHGGKDTVRCGRGEDKAIVDGRDEVSGCETVVER